jgi:serine/threonine protein kinase
MDLKLENILVRDNMDLALSDFGFSLRSDEDTNHFLGTEYYIAPEVYINRNPYLK